MKQFLVFITVLLIFNCSFSSIWGQGNWSVYVPDLRGYIKEMPALRLDKIFSDPEFIKLTHNRLNFRWRLSDNFLFAIEGRNRVFYNRIFRNFPEYSGIIGKDAGIVDLSWVWLSEGSWIGHSMVDRLYGDWRMDKWHVRVGRQRINWGINLVSNPNDLFNTYSFFDFDYVERPGSDAIRIQHYPGDLSIVQLAVSPAGDYRDMVAASMIGTNWNEYDIQVLAGYYRHRLTLGGGWAGGIGGAGLKGEVTWFYDLEEQEGVGRGNIVAATGIDYMFPNDTFGVLEFLYNGGYGRKPGEVILVTQPLQPDNIMFSKYAVTMSIRHFFATVLQGGMAFMALPDIDAVFLMPSLEYSLTRNFDFEFISQIFLGGDDTIFEEAGSSFFFSLRYSF